MPTGNQLQRHIAKNLLFTHEINLLPFWPFINLYVLKCNVNLAQKVIECN